MSELEIDCDSRRKKILLVDDDPDLTSRIEQLLEDTYDVETTSDWSQFSALIYKQAWDLILMDVNLPTISGDKLVEIVGRASPKTSSKIYYFSSDDADTLARLVRETGAAGYISKSLRSVQLLQRIEDLTS